MDAKPYLAIVDSAVQNCRKRAHGSDPQHADDERGYRFKPRHCAFEAFYKNFGSAKL